MKKKKTEKKKKFPKTIVISQVDDGYNGVVLLAHTEIKDAARIGKDVEIGIYTL